MRRPPRLWIVAGDVSGDQNAGRLARALRSQRPDVEILGAGGAEMRAAGVDVEFDTTDLSFVGLPGPKLIWSHYRLYHAVFRRILASEADLVVLVDNEWTNLALATRLRLRRVPLAFFFPPQVWLWGRWRLPAIVPLARRVVSVFRDEAELYRSAGAETVWVGHPLCDAVNVRGDADEALRRIGLDPDRPLVALMPGSRHNEIGSLTEPFLEAARLLQAKDPSLQFALPLASEFLRAPLEEAVRRSGLRDAVVYRPASYAVLSRARVIVQCSGTATLESALLGIPSVIAYRCANRFHYLVARYLLIHCDYIGMVNILLGDMVQPEFFHRDVDAQHLAAEAWSLLTDESRRAAIQARLAEIRGILGAPGSFDRAARALLELVPAGAGAPVAAVAARVSLEAEPRRLGVGGR